MAIRGKNTLWPVHRELYCSREGSVGIPETLERAVEKATPQPSVRVNLQMPLAGWTGSISGTLSSDWIISQVSIFRRSGGL